MSEAITYTYQQAYDLLPLNLRPTLELLKNSKQERVKEFYAQESQYDMLVVFTLELLRVIEGKKFICFGWEFWPEYDDANHAFWQDCLAIIEELSRLGLKYSIKHVEHKGHKGQSYTFYTDRIDSIAVADLHAWVFNEVNYKRLPPYMKHVYYGLIAGFSVDESLQHIENLQKED